MGRDELLLNAAKHGKVDCVVNFIDEGANVNSATRCYGTTPLHWACMNGHEKVVQVLLDRGAKVKARNRDGMVALHYACRESHLRITRLLLDNGADINAQDIFGFTALHYASKSGSKKCLSLLLSRSADTNSPTRVGKNPLDLAKTEEVMNLFHCHWDNL